MRRSALGARLERLGYASWYEEATRAAYLSDPWAAFELAARSCSAASGRLRPILDLFVANRPVPEREVSESLGTTSTRWLQDKGVLISDADGLLSSELCLLVTFGRFLFADWPVHTPSQHLSCQKTYLSSGTFECARFVLQHQADGEVLDLGSGTGLLTVLLARQRSRVSSIDIEPRANWLTQINCLANGAKAHVIQESWRNLLHEERFNLIIANPPWRIVPPDVIYPDPSARVGTGLGGLQKVIEVLELIPHLLAASGKAAVRFDLPLDGHGRCPFSFDLKEILGQVCEHNLEVLGEVTAEQQSRRSADGCAHLNAGRTGLSERFIKYYQELGVETLNQVLCVIHKP